MDSEALRRLETVPQASIPEEMLPRSLFSPARGPLFLAVESPSSALQDYPHFLMSHKPRLLLGVWEGAIVPASSPNAKLFEVNLGEF